MSTKIVSFVYFAMLSMTLSSLTSCPAPIIPPVKTDFEQPTVINGTIADFVLRPGSPADVEYRAKNGTLMAKALARDDGTFTLVLPSAADVTAKLKESNLLVFLAFLTAGFGEEQDCTGKIILSAAIPTYVMTTLGFTQGSFDTDRKISSGTVSVVNGEPNIDQDFWIFATSPTTFTGERKCKNSKSRASLFLKKGWNATNVKFSSSSSEVIVQSVEPVATDWRSNPSFFPIE